MKMKLFAGIVVMAVLMTAGCEPASDDDNRDKPVPVTGVSLSDIALTLTVGESRTLIATVSPDGATNKAVTWRSQDKAKAEVDEGVVTAKAIGTVMIYATTVDGSRMAYCEITIIPSNELSKESILADIDVRWASLGYTEKPAKFIALSFDDGPSGVTQSLINALDAKKVKATFFLIGSNVRSNQAGAKAIFDAGHELANHSDGWDSLGSSTAAAIRTSLTAASTAIKGITGDDPVLFRAPNVNYGANLTSVCTELELAIIGVSVWSNDWQGPTTTEQIIANVTNNPQDGDIINCHEYVKTVDAIPNMIDGLRNKGFWIMTVGQLAIVKEKTLAAGTQYDSIR